MGLRLHHLWQRLLASRRHVAPFVYRSLRCLQLRLRRDWRQRLLSSAPLLLFGDWSLRRRYLGNGHLRRRLLPSGRSFLPIRRGRLIHSILWSRTLRPSANRRLNAFHSAHIHHANGSAWRRSTLAHSLNSGCRKRASRILS